MAYNEGLGIVANWAAILTAVVATTAYGRFLYQQIRQRRALENHLRSEMGAGRDSGKRTVLHLMAALSLTEAEVLSAAFRSRKISPAIITDTKGRADGLLFVYDGPDAPIPKKD
ncbi:hypothetical protein [Labrenzia sp. OB1]|uniref:hypothetical protein n=1 Tax=Labrenzia sp. OB1 TaxID=1561204 RepID=UPI0007B2FECE|nr:hypothetical protein [Labrenzia sp. OB1]KZM50183.1 hypothetical protein OA90_12240 [Labrenzia sp. OB1]